MNRPRLNDDQIGSVVLALMFLIAGFLAVRGALQAAPMRVDPFDPSSAVPYVNEEK